MFKYQFGTYAYEQPDESSSSGSIITTAPREMTVRQRTADAPGNRRLYTAGGLPAAIRRTLSGTLIARSGDDVEDLWPLFVAAHAPGLPQPLYIDSPDWYLMAEVSAVRDVDAANVVGSIPWEVEFLAQDPLWWADTASTTAGVLAGDGLSATLALATGGTAPARVAITITLSAIGAIPDGATYPLTTSNVALANTTTGVTGPLLWARTHASDLVCDCAAESVAQGGADAQACLLSGAWLDLAPNTTNHLTVTASGGAVISDVSAAWRNRRW